MIKFAQAESVGAVHTHTRLLNNKNLKIEYSNKINKKIV